MDKNIAFISIYLLLGCLLCTKLDRLAKRNRREYDPHDAAVYLRRYIERHGGTLVPVVQIKRWAAQYRTNAMDEAIQEMDTLYAENYGTRGVRWRSPTLLGLRSFVLGTVM